MQNYFKFVPVDMNTLYILRVMFTFPSTLVSQAICNFRLTRDIHVCLYGCFIPNKITLTNGKKNVLLNALKPSLHVYKILTKS